MRKRIGHWPTLVALAVFLLGAVPLRAQIELSVQPRLSSVVPMTQVYNVDRALGTAGEPWDREVSASTLSTSPALAVAVQFGDPTSGWMIRSGVTRSLGSTTLVQGELDPWGPGEPLLGPPPPRHTFRFTLPSSLTIGFAEAVLPLLLGTPAVRPYVSVGAAVKRYSWGSFDPLACESVGPSCDVLDFSVPRDATVLGVQVGTGLSIDLGRRSLELGVVDAFNRYDGHARHDLSIFAGTSITLSR